MILLEINQTTNMYMHRLFVPMFAPYSVNITVQSLFGFLSSVHDYRV